MGSPIVFQTAPPQPSSNAFITWYPVFVGGPDASQNGFGDRTPQKSTLRSGMGSPRCIDQDPVNAAGGPLTIRHGIDHFSSAVHAIAAGEVLRIPRLHGFRIHHHATVVE